MATTKKYLDYDGLVQYTGKVKKAVNDASYTHGVTDIDGTTTAPSVHNTVNATMKQRNATFTKDGSSDSFPYYDTTYGNAVAGSMDGLMSRTDKTKLDGIATGAEANVQSDWNQTTTTADDYIKNKPDVNKVKQTTQSGSDPLPILVSTQKATSISSGTDYEAGYDTDLKFTPSTNVLTIGTATINGANAHFNGKAMKTEDDLSLASESTNGAEMVGYQDGDNHNNNVFDGLETVDDALNAIIGVVDNMSLDGTGVRVDVDGTNLNISSGDTLDSVVQTIDTAIGTKQDKLAAGSNISFSGTGNNTINAVDEKVNQTATSESADIPMLLASGATPSNGGAKYDTDLKYNPSTNTLKLGTGTLTAANYSGNAATATNATNDGSGNNIINTYATKAALDALSQKWTGQFMVIKNSGDTQAMYAAMTRIIAAIKGGEAPATADMALFELGYIYLYPSTVVAEDNVFDEYIKVLELNGADYTMEKIGTTDAGVDVVSLTPAEINTIWSTTAAAS